MRIRKALRRYKQRATYLRWLRSEAIMFTKQRRLIDTAKFKAEKTSRMRENKTPPFGFPR